MKTAKNYKRTTLDLELIDTSVLCSALLKENLNIEIAPYSEHSLEHLPFIDNHQKQTILTQLQRIADSVVTKNELSNLDFMKLELSMFCKDNGFDYPFYFMNSMDDDDVIEIYDSETKMQIYCNHNMMKFINYDNLTFRMHPYPELFDRDLNITMKIMERSDEVVREKQECVDWGIDDHQLIEKINPKRPIFKLQLKKIGCLMLRDGTPSKFWISSIGVEKMGYENLHIINFQGRPRV